MDTKDTFDLTPTWREVAKIIELGLTCGTAEGKRFAREELTHMADMLDNLNSQQKETS